MGVQQPTTGGGPAPDVGTVLGEINRLLDSVADPQAWRLDEEQVAEQTLAAYQTATRMHTLALRLLAELDARGLAAQQGAEFDPVWLKHQIRMRPETAKRDVALARLIGPAPADDAASSIDADADAAIEDDHPVGGCGHQCRAGGRAGQHRAGRNRGPGVARATRRRDRTGAAGRRAHDAGPSRRA